ncbi:MAG: chaperone protein DnaJ [Herpetosiphonaceae bacterium]|nr:MAG: chaperone protein DnaJ [Herpetosiphonaceae bacterium]
MSSTAKRDYYEVLGINRNASQDEIKRAYRQLAKKYHPDHNREDGAEARFKEINEAYEVLSNPEKRALYDRFGHAGLGGSVGVDPFGGFGGADPFTTIFDAFFGQGVRGSAASSRPHGSDLRVEIRLTFEEAVFGTEKEIEYRRQELCGRCSGRGAEPGTEPVRCPRCAGKGEVRTRTPFFNMVSVTTCDQCYGEGTVIAIPCKECRGDGRTRRSVRRKVSIPAGVDSSIRIRLSGEGDYGPRGGPPGDLYVHLQVDEHPYFVRNGYDVILELPINVAQAALGDEVVVPTVDGEEVLKIVPGTQDGTTFKFRGKGVPILRGSGRGDHIVVVRVKVPTKLTERQRELFQELAETMQSESGGNQHEGGFFSKIFGRG